MTRTRTRQGPDWKPSLRAVAEVVAALVLMGALVATAVEILDRFYGADGVSGDLASEVARSAVVALIGVLNLLVVGIIGGGLIRAFFPAGKNGTLRLMAREGLRGVRVLGSITGVAATASLLVFATAIPLVDREDPISVSELLHVGSVQLAVSIAAMAVAAPFVVAESIAVLFHDLPLLDTSWAKVVVPAALTAFLLFLGMQSRAPGPPSLLVALVAFAGIVVERWVREHRNPPSGAR